MVCFCCSYCPTFQIFVASLPMEAWLGGNLYQNNGASRLWVDLEIILSEKKDRIWACIGIITAKMGILQ